MTESYYLRLSESKQYYLTLPDFLELMKCQLLGIKKQLNKGLSKLLKAKENKSAVPQRAMDCIYSIVNGEARNYINDHHFECAQYRYSCDGSLTGLYNSLDTFKKQFIRLCTHNGFQMYRTVQIRVDNANPKGYRYIGLRIKEWNRLSLDHLDDSVIARHGHLWSVALGDFCDHSNVHLAYDPVSFRDVQQLIHLMVKSIHRQINNVDKQAVSLEKRNKLYVPKDKIPLEIPPKILAL